MQSNRMITQIHLDKSHENYILNTLINNSAKNNFLSQKLIMKEEILIKDTKVSAHTLDDHLFMIYRWATCEMHAIVLQEIKHDFQQLFLTANIVYYDVILRWSWLIKINSDYN